jgi:hypothetical protein
MGTRSKWYSIMESGYFKYLVLPFCHEKTLNPSITKTLIRASCDSSKKQVNR